MSALGDYQYQGAFPSVSKEQWVKHAIKKLSKGYRLIISDERGVANFYRGAGELEPCSMFTAKRLVKQGYVQPCGQHDLGALYEIKPEYRETIKMKPPASTPPPARIDDDLDDEEMADDGLEDDLLSELNIEEADDEEEFDDDTLLEE